MQKQHHTIEDELHKIGEVRKKVGGEFVHFRNSTFSRFPFLFIFLSTFGLVATFYGFEKIIDSVPFFHNHPFMILFSGIVALTLTGTLYKKLR
jgi:hypothetical protein